MPWDEDSNSDSDVRVMLEGARIEALSRVAPVYPLCIYNLPMYIH